MDGADAESPVTEATLFLLLLDLGLAVVALMIFAAMIIRAARYPGLAPLIAPLAMLSALALVIGGIADIPALITLAATGVGALAAVLTKTFNAEDPPKVQLTFDDEDEDA